MPRVLGESGIPVLLIAGGAETSEGFYPGLPEGLMEDPGARIVYADRPGAGDAKAEGGLADASAAIHASLVELGTTPVVVIGQSLGGAVAVLLAADHPEDVAGLVLLDPTPINDPELAIQIGKRTRSTVTLFGIPLVGGALRTLLRSTAKRSARRHGMGPAARAASLAITDLDVPRLGRSVVGIEDIAANLDLSRLPKVPAVVVTADRKPGDPVRRAHERLAEVLGARLVSYPKAEHQVHLTHPAEVLATSREVVRAAAT